MIRLLIVICVLDLFSEIPHEFIGVFIKFRRKEILTIDELYIMLNKFVILCNKFTQTISVCLIFSEQSFEVPAVGICKVCKFLFAYGAFKIRIAFMYISHNILAKLPK